MTTIILASMPHPGQRRSVQLSGAGVAAIALAIGFNIPYALLGQRFDYPAILRRPAAEALARFADGGPALVASWYGFALAAILLVPTAIALSITPQRLATRPALAIGAAVTGALAGVTQAIGLLRWVFAVPVLAAAQRLADANPMTARAAVLSYDMLNAWGGVGIGEHLGQILTAMFVGQLALVQRAEARAMVALLGLVTALALTIGSAEGPAMALGFDGSGFGAATVTGFLGLTLWLLATGLTHNRA